ncbi:hypothetical protein GCM10009766_03110 [Microcella frigidaquae]
MLAQDERAVSALVHADGRSHVARVFASTADPAAVEQELAVHDLLATAPAALRQHVVGLADLFTLPDGRLVALLDPVPGCRLDELLRPSAVDLSPGEAVTVLAPLVGAVAAGHELGLTGLPLRPSAIRFTAAGAPMIVELGDARVSPPLPDRYRATEPAYRADSAALRALADAVASALPPAEAEALRGILETVTMEGERGAAASALFGLAVPEPIRLEERAAVMLAPPPSVPRPFAPPAAAALSWPPAALDTGSSSASQSAEQSSVAGSGQTAAGASGRVSRVVDETLRAIALPEGVRRPILRGLQVAEFWLDDRRQRVGQREAVAPAGRAERDRGARPRLRPRYALMGAAGAAALLAAVVLAQDAGDASAETAAHDTLTDDGTGEAEEPQGGVTGIPDSAATRDAPERLLRPDVGEWPEIVATLVERWVACRGEESVADGDGARADRARADCAENVAHAGSAAAALIALDDERHAVLAAWARGGGEAVVVERMGGAVLVDLVASGPGGTTAASLLVMRSEAGWRIRDVLG